MNVPASDPTTSFLTGLNPFDWFLLLVLLYSTVRALIRGLLLELFSFFGIIAGILLAAWNYQALAAWLSAWIHNPPLANTSAFLLIVIVTTVLCGLVGRILRRTAQAIGLGLFDRIFGALFGFARGALFCIALLLSAAAFLPTASWVSTSQLSPYFLTGAHAVSFVVPRDLQQRFRNGATRLKHTSPDWIKPPR